MYIVIIYQYMYTHVLQSFASQPQYHINWYDTQTKVLRITTENKISQCSSSEIFQKHEKYDF